MNLNSALNSEDHKKYWRVHLKLAQAICTESAPAYISGLITRNNAESSSIVGLFVKMSCGVDSKSWINCLLSSMSALAMNCSARLMFIVTAYQPSVLVLQTLNMSSHSRWLFIFHLHIKKGSRCSSCNTVRCSHSSVLDSKSVKAFCVMMITRVLASIAP